MWQEQGHPQQQKHWKSSVVDEPGFWFGFDFDCVNENVPGHVGEGKTVTGIGTVTVTAPC